MKSLIVLAVGVLFVSLGSHGQLSDSAANRNEIGYTNGELLWKTIVPFYLDRVFLELGQMSSGKLRTDLFNGVSSKCAGHVTEWISQITNSSSDLLQAESWALHLTDAWAKAPEGFLSGHTNALGDYDECVGVRSKDETSFRGKYCISTVYPRKSLNAKDFSVPQNGTRSEVIEELMEFIADPNENVPWLVPSFGSCFPSTCLIDDADNFVQNVFKSLNVEKTLDFYMFDCITDETLTFDTGDIVYSCVLGLVILICLLATLVDFCTPKKSPNGNDSKGQAAFLAFSFKQSLTKWLSTKTDDEDKVGLRCLSGLRFLTVAWIILAHTWEMPILGYYPAWNKVALKKLHQHWSTILITNSNVAMDTFFTISGLTVSYSLLRALDKYKNRIISIVIPFARGLLRLTPMYALIIGFVATLWPFLGSGPYSGFLVDGATTCQNNWWTNLLYINNFVNASFENMCLTDSWYFANEMQFLLLSPLIILSLWKWRSTGLFISIIAIAASVITPAILTQDREELPSNIPTRDTRQSRKYFEDIYIKPWIRASPYLCGLICGYAIYITDKSVKLSKLVILAGWLLSTAAALAIILGIFPYFDPSESIPKTEAALYAGFHRFGWGIIISWIVFACAKGYGGSINLILSWKVFVPLGKLATATYLVSLPVQMIWHLGFRQTLTHDSYTMVNFFLADLVMSLFVGFLFMMVIGMPCYQLDAILLKQETEDTNEDDEIEMRPRQERFGVFYDKDVSVTIEPEKKSKRRRGGGETSIEMQPRNERHGIYYNKAVSPSEPEEPTKKR